MLCQATAEAGMAEEEDGKPDPKQAATLGPDPVVGEAPGVEGAQAATPGSPGPWPQLSLSDLPSLVL